MHLEFLIYVILIVIIIALWDISSFAILVRMSVIVLHFFLISVVVRSVPVLDG